MSKTFIFSPDRDIWLEADDEELAVQCRMDFFKAQGRGGQKRNKTSNAVRFTHLSTNIAADDCSSRSQHQNRSTALKKLRYQIALKVRSEQITPPTRLDVSLNNAEYPLFVARLLDIILDKQFYLSDAAAALEISTSKLIKILQRDKVLWQLIQKYRS